MITTRITTRSMRSHGVCLFGFMSFLHWLISSQPVLTDAIADVYRAAILLVHVHLGHPASTHADLLSQFLDSLGPVVASPLVDVKRWLTVHISYLSGCCLILIEYPSSMIRLSASGVSVVVPVSAANILALPQLGYATVFPYTSLKSTSISMGASSGDGVPGVGCVYVYVILRTFLPSNYGTPTQGHRSRTGWLPRTRTRIRSLRPAHRHVCMVCMRM